MRHKYLVLLLSLAVGLGGCQKDGPEPAPALEDRWTPETTTEYYFDATGTLSSQKTKPLPKDYYLLITKDSLYYRSTSDNSSLGHYKYTRQGNSFTFARANCLITELTDHRLVIRFQASGIAPGSAYAEAEDMYSR